MNRTHFTILSSPGRTISPHTAKALTISDDRSIQQLTKHRREANQQHLVLKLCGKLCSLFLFLAPFRETFDWLSHGAFLNGESLRYISGIRK